MDQAKNIIETSMLTRKFGTLTAVDSISISIREGEIFGLLGPNGAGKTTLISMLVTMKRPTSGGAKVNGFDITKDSDAVRRSIGIVFQDQSLDEELTAYENLEMHCAMYGVDAQARKERIESVIQAVELKDRLNDVVKTFSGGMRRRLEIARGLLHYPKVLFLDEPTIGLDPQTRKHIWAYIKKLKEEHSITIVLTTHYLEEADSFCDRVGIIDRGRIIALGTPAELKDSLGGDTIELEVLNPEKAAGLEKGMECIKEAKNESNRIIFRVQKGEECIPKLLERCAKAGVQV
ncbi:MAG: ATP-binding cassette domain-containing protein, partial [Candidatus Micrarchaeia archaeon]